MASELEKQQKIWYKKLKDEGFKDIEDPTGPRNGGRGAPRVDNLNEVQQDAIREYYSMARQFFTEYKFKDKVDKLIWEQYSEGIAVRQISTILKTKSIIKAKSSIWQRVKKLEKLMYAKYMGDQCPPP